MRLVAIATVAFLAFTASTVAPQTAPPQQITPADGSLDISAKANASAQLASRQTADIQTL